LTGRDIQAQLRQVSSLCARIETATTCIRSAECERRTSAASTDDSGSWLSDSRSEVVELATSELLSSVHQLSTAVTKLA